MIWDFQFNAIQASGFLNYSKILYKFDISLGNWYKLHGKKQKGMDSDSIESFEFYQWVSYLTNNMVQPEISYKLSGPS